MKAYLASAGTLLGGGLLFIVYSIAPLTRPGCSRLGCDRSPAALEWSDCGHRRDDHRSRSDSLALPSTIGVRWIMALAGALAVYLLSVAVVDEFQSRVGDAAITLETLQKQAQVALSILWATLGGTAFAAGILRFGPPVRIFGLALALATIKVFIVDLASLDTSYGCCPSSALASCCWLAPTSTSTTRTASIRATEGAGRRRKCRPASMRDGRLRRLAREEGR
ncbi:MAG: DUF2339 domain-containing protein [Thermomicrobiales bacterium]